MTDEERGRVDDPSRIFYYDALSREHRSSTRCENQVQPHIDGKLKEPGRWKMIEMDFVDALFYF